MFRTLSFVMNVSFFCQEVRCWSAPSVSQLALPDGFGAALCAAGPTVHTTAPLDATSTHVTSLRFMSCMGPEPLSAVAREADVEAGVILSARFPSRSSVRGVRGDSTMQNDLAGPWNARTSPQSRFGRDPSD